MPEALLVGQKEALRNCMLLLSHPLYLVLDGLKLKLSDYKPRVVS